MKKKKNVLKNSNQNLKLQLENMLQCDDCDNTFSDKTQIFNHIKSNHYERKNLDFKCDNCNDGFADKSNMKDPMGEDHQVTGVKGVKCNSNERIFQLQIDMKKHKIRGHIDSAREDIHKRQTELLKKITLQKINIVNSLYKLKQTEHKKKETCSCKGFCRILHSRFRWKPS